MGTRSTTSTVRRKKRGATQGSVYDVYPRGTQVTMVDSGWISAGDKAAGKYLFVPKLARERTTQNALVMGWLKGRGHPLAYIRQLDGVSIRCLTAEMLPLEIVVRGRGLEGFVKQFGGEAGQRFKEPKCILYAKQALDLRDPAKPKWASLHDIKQGAGDTPEGVYTDPLVMELPDGRWAIHSAKGRYDPDKPLHVCEALVPPGVVAQAKRIAVEAFKDLRWAIRSLPSKDLKALGCGVRWAELADFKVEVGWVKGADDEKRLVIADVLPLDSMRIIPNGAWKSWRNWFSKEPLRKCKTKQRAVIAKMLVGPKGTYTRGTALLRLLAKVA